MKVVQQNNTVRITNGADRCLDSFGLVKCTGTPQNFVVLQRTSVAKQKQGEHHSQIVYMKYQYIKKERIELGVQSTSS